MTKMVHGFNQNLDVAEIFPYIDASFGVCLRPPPRRGRVGNSPGVLGLETRYRVQGCGVRGSCVRSSCVVRAEYIYISLFLFGFLCRPIIPYSVPGIVVNS